MANIKHLQMAKAICADSRIDVRKTMLGLRSVVTYLPTNSVVEAKTVEYTPEAGDRLRSILEGPRAKLADALEAFSARPVANGNYMLEACVSRDGEFAALQLLHYSQMSYVPVSSVLFYEGDEAHIVGKLFWHHAPCARRRAGEVLLCGHARVFLPAWPPSYVPCIGCAASW